MRAALITGITGQDGSYLAELLLAKGYAVFGLLRRNSSGAMNLHRLRHLVGHERLTLLCGDVLDLASLADALTAARAAAGDDRLEVYNLAAQSFVQASFEAPLYTVHVNALGAFNVLEAVRRCGAPDVRVCQASTSEMFGASAPPQGEATPFWPRSPYGVSKLCAYWAVRNYREAYGLFACNALSFNHESERRGPEFVTRKVSLGVARLATDAAAPPLALGNLDARRDWAHATDVVAAMWQMLQLDVPDDYVVGTGEHHSVREFVEAAFEVAGMAVEWRGQGAEEVGVDAETGRALVVVDQAMVRPAEVDWLHADASKLRAATGWVPRVDFRELVGRMVRRDVAAAARRDESPETSPRP